MSLVRVLALLLAACGPLTPPKVDGGVGGGGAATGGGGVAGGGGSATGGGGGSATGGGSSTDGGDGIWDFSSVTFNPAPTSSGAIVGFAETDAGIWAVSGSGRVYRSTGGAFTELFMFPGSLQPLDFEASASGHFFIVTTVHFLECAAECADAGAWTDRRIAPANEVLSALCVIDGSHVLALGSRGAFSDGISYRWNGTTLASTAALLGVVSPANCWRGATGDFFIPSEDNVLRYAPATQGFTPEPTTTTKLWKGGGSSPGHEWVTGSGPVIAERGQTTWTDAFTDSAASIVSVVGISASLAFAFGGGFSSSGQAGFRFNGTSWSAMTPDIPVMNVSSSAFRGADGTVYVGGNDASQFPAIVRGVRR